MARSREQGRKTKTKHVCQVCQEEFKKAKKLKNHLNRDHKGQAAELWAQKVKEYNAGDATTSAPENKEADEVATGPVNEAPQPNTAE